MNYEMEKEAQEQHARLFFLSESLQYSYLTAKMAPISDIAPKRLTFQEFLVDYLLLMLDKFDDVPIDCHKTAT